jgi:adhesin HecA-like repeat protein
MKWNREVNAIWLVVAAALVTQAGAQILTGDQLKKIAPSSFFFAGQSAAVQLRNAAGLKNSAGKVVLAGLVDTSGYSTAIAEKYQGFLITEGKLSLDGTTLDPGEYGFGFKDDKFIVMNVAGTDLLSVASHTDEQIKHPVPLKLEKDGAGYRLYAGRKYAVLKAD